MLRITFKYRDKWSNWEWVTRDSVNKSIEECIKFYGLGVDCDYEIISVEEIDS